MCDTLLVQTRLVSPHSGAVSLGLTEILGSAPLQTLSLRGFLGDGLGSGLVKRLRGWCFGGVFGAERTVLLA